MGAAIFFSKLSLKIVLCNGALRHTAEAWWGTNRPRLAEWVVLWPDWPPFQSEFPRNFPLNFGKNDYFFSLTILCTYSFPPIDRTDIFTLTFLSKCMHDKLKKIKIPIFLFCTKRTGLVSYRGCNYYPPRSARGHFRTIPFHYLINMKRLKLARFQDLHANTDSNITRLTHFYFLQKRGRGQRWKSWINCVFNNAIINVCMNTIKIKTNICFSFFIFYFVSLH